MAKRDEKVRKRVRKLRWKSCKSVLKENRKNKRMWKRKCRNMGKDVEKWKKRLKSRKKVKKWKK